MRWRKASGEEGCRLKLSRFREVLSNLIDEFRLINVHHFFVGHGRSVVEGGARRQEDRG
jgi:hypothetical protein